MMHPRLAGPQPLAVPDLCFPHNISVDLNRPYRLAFKNEQCRSVAIDRSAPWLSLFRRWSQNERAGC